MHSTLIDSKILKTLSAALQATDREKNDKQRNAHLLSGVDQHLLSGD
jgi:hypothetical protein